MPYGFWTLWLFFKAKWCGKRSKTGYSLEGAVRGRVFEQLEMAVSQNHKVTNHDINSNPLSLSILNLQHDFTFIACIWMIHFNNALLNKFRLFTFVLHKVAAVLLNIRNDSELLLVYVERFCFEVNILPSIDCWCCDLNHTKRKNAWAFRSSVCSEDRLGHS